MTKEEIIKAKQLIAYGKKLMCSIDKMNTQYTFELTERDGHDSFIESSLIERIERHFDSMDDGYILNNFYDDVKEYHRLTLDALDVYLASLYVKEDNDSVLYIIKQLLSVRDIICSYEIERLYTDNNLVNFDIRTYFKAVTSPVAETISESLDYLINRLNSDPALSVFIFEGIDYLKKIHVFTKTCRIGDEWDASLFELEQLENEYYTLDENLINKVCKVHRRVYMIRYDNTYYKLVPGKVSIWRASEA